MKTLFFLSGLARSGSTLLGSLLSQHPEIHTTPTSPLADLLCVLDKAFDMSDIQYTYDKPKVQYNTYNAILSNFYNHIPKKYILDKHRGWPRNVLSTEKFLDNEVKIVATYRPIPEVLTSFITLIDKDENNFIDDRLKNDNLPITTDNRLEYLWRFYTSDVYESLIYGLRHHREKIHLVEYNNLIKDPEKELNSIYEFLNIEPHKHDFSNILNTCAEEKDNEWGLKNLHKIRPKLERKSRSPKEVIGEENVKLYSVFNIYEN
jgi:sulfotransferase